MTEGRKITWRTGRKNLTEGVTGEARKAPEVGDNWFALIVRAEGAGSVRETMNVRYVHASKIDEILVQCDSPEAIAAQEAIMAEADGVKPEKPKADKKPTAKASAKG